MSMTFTNTIEFQDSNERIQIVKPDGSVLLELSVNEYGKYSVDDHATGRVFDARNRN